MQSYANQIECLGYDRHGRRFFYVDRRIIVECDESVEIWYYSSVSQYRELISRLDDGSMEQQLCKNLNKFRTDIENQINSKESRNRISKWKIDI